MNTRHTIVTLLLGSLLMAGCAGNRNEYFTGTIEYAYTYTSDSMNADSLAAVRPSRGVFRYDTAAYQSRFFGRDTLTFHYSGRHNKAIMESGIGLNRSCEDYSRVTDSVLSVKTSDTEEKILGHSCRVVEIQKKNSTVIYYYSTDLQMAPLTYQHHRAYNWDVYGQAARGGIALKLEHRFPGFTMKGTATAIHPSAGSFSALEVPAGLFDSLCR